MSARFNILNTEITDLQLFERKVIGDSRGYFERMYCQDDLSEVLGDLRIAQINHSFNHLQGVVRGMHFQNPPHAECKIVSCISGAIFDVAIDLRRNSPTFLHWHGELLSDDNHRTFVVPEGFAHGFQTLTADTELLYFSTAAYEPDAEGAIHAEDPRIGIQWPKPISEMSDKDCAQLFLTNDYAGFDV